MSGSLVEKPSAMPHEEDAPPPYSGSYCVIRPEGGFYTVSVEPRLPSGVGSLMTFATKIGAWGQMLAWCQQYGLPLKDFTDGKVGPRS